MVNLSFDFSITDDEEKQNKFESTGNIVNFQHFTQSSKKNKKEIKEKEEKVKSKLKTKHKRTFYYLFDCLVDVLKEYEVEKELLDSNRKDSSKIEEEHNIFSQVLFKLNINFYSEVYKKALYLIEKLNLEENEILISFIYIERLLNKDKFLLINESLEK